MWNVEAKGEGTFELRGRTSSSPSVFTEHPGSGGTPQFNLNLPRRTILYVDVLNPNEVVDFYTSVTNNTDWDIGIWRPGRDPDTTAPDATINVTSSGPGRVTDFSDVQNVQSIATRPRPPVTYVPTFGTGAYGIVIRGQSGSSGSSGSSGVEFWDARIRDTAGTPSLSDDTLRSGRVFTYHLASNNTSFNNGFFWVFYVVSGTDFGTSYSGNTWRVDMSGMRPFGFHTYANDQGAEPSQYNFLSISQTANPQPQMIPQYPLYFNPPEKPVFAPVTPSVSQFRFIPICNSSQVISGGVFRFVTNGNWTYEIVIDENQDGIYDIFNEEFLRGRAVPGTNNVVWDGSLQNTGLATQGANIEVRLRAKAGEVHFPFFDVENRGQLAGPTIELFSSVSNVFSSRYFWDDRLISGGTTSGSDGSLAKHEWVSDFGNEAIIDTWKYADASDRALFFTYECDIEDLNISIEPSQTSTTFPGSTVRYDHTVTNNSISSDSVRITYSNTLPGVNWIWYEIDFNGTIIGTPQSSGAIMSSFLPFERKRIRFEGFFQQNIPEASVDVLSIAATSTTNSTNNDSVQDVTTVLSSRVGALRLFKSVDKSTASPGEELTYTIVFVNIGADAVSALEISDPVSPYATFVDDAFGVGRDIELLLPDATTVYLTADADADGGLVADGIVRIDYGALSIGSGQSGSIRYKVSIN